MGDFRHWDALYLSKSDEELSWFEPIPETSLRLISTWSEPTHPVLDVGAGRSRLGATLLSRGFKEVWAVDLSAEALGGAGEHDALGVHRLVGDVLETALPQQLGTWHDRAVFHFLIDEQHQERYVRRAAGSVRSGGVIVLGCFGPEGPDSCSGLHVARHSADDLEEHFGEWFALEASTLESHVTPGGATQQFCWVVLRRR